MNQADGLWRAASRRVAALWVVGMLGICVTACGGRDREPVGAPPVGAEPGLVGGAPPSGPPGPPVVVPAPAATTGTLSIVVGDPEAERGDRLSAPSDRYFSTLTVDPAGTVYLAFECSIQRVGADRVAREFVGGTCGYGDGAGATAKFNRIYGIVADRNGDLYVSDTGNAVLRRVSARGDVTTVSGAPMTPGSVDGAGAVARWQAPREITVDRDGNVFVVDDTPPIGGGRRVRKLTPSGDVASVPGGALPRSRPGRIAVDSVGALYLTVVTSSGFCAGQCFSVIEDAYVLKIDPRGVATTLAGPATPSTGALDGPATDARFDYPSDIAVDSVGNVYVADLFNESIRMISPPGVVSTVVGALPPSSGSGSRTLDRAQVGGTVVPGALPGRLRLPHSLAMGPGRSLYISVNRRVEVNPGSGAIDGPGLAVVRAELPRPALAGVRQHQAALQAIADANGGHRVASSPGDEPSAVYAAQVLRAAGYAVTRQFFDLETFIRLAPSRLDQVLPAPGGAIAHAVALYSGSGDVTAAVTKPSPATGCTAGAFAGFPAGHIALVARGDCTFAAKADNAFRAGAAGVVLHNNAAGDLQVSLLAGFTPHIPVVFVSQTDGERLAATAGLTLRLQARTVRGTVRSSNVLAELPGTGSDRVVMIGAHLDSVNDGPGINDNGSGVGAVLEAAVLLSKSRPYNTVRVVLWGAEEADHLGSKFYVGGLTTEQKDRIALYLNFDMIGSPNPVFFVYDGDGSDSPGAGAGPPGSAEIEKVFADHYRLQGVPFKSVALSLYTDHLSLMAVGIPVGGLFSGNDTVKSAQEAALWGGTAGAPHDPCYHRACDTYANTSELALRVNAEAVAAAAWHFAMKVNPASRSAEPGIEGRAGGLRTPFMLPGAVSPHRPPSTL